MSEWILLMIHLAKTLIWMVCTRVTAELLKVAFLSYHSSAEEEKRAKWKLVLFVVASLLLFYICPITGLYIYHNFPLNPFSFTAALILCLTRFLALDAVCQISWEVLKSLWNQAKQRQMIAGALSVRRRRVRVGRNGVLREWYDYEEVQTNQTTFLSNVIFMFFRM